MGEAGAVQRGGPKFRAVFVLLKILIVVSLSGGLHVEFWWCLKRQGAQIRTFGVLWVILYEPQRLVWWRWVSQDDLESPKRPNLSTLDFKNTSKIQRKERQRGKIRLDFWVGEGKNKSEILGGPTEEGSAKGGPKEGCRGGGGPEEGSSA